VTSEHTLTFKLADTVVVVTSAVVGAAVVGPRWWGTRSSPGLSVVAGLVRGRWGRWGLYGLGGRSRCVAGVVGVPDFALLPQAARVRAIARMAHVARVLLEFTMPFPMLKTRVGRQIAGR
jgi:hypothetical protein